MSAKKAGKAPTHTSKKRARFPRIEAALAGPPLTEAAAEPTTAEAAPVEDAAEMTAPGPGQAEATPEATGLEGPAGDAATTDQVTASDPTPPAGATRPEPATADGAAAPSAVEALTTEALAEAAGQAPATQATTEPPTVEGAGTEATAEGAGAEGTAPDAAPPEPAGTAPEVAPAAAGAATETDQPKKGRKPRATKTRGGAGGGAAKKLSALDAAAKVLGEAGQPMGCKEMIAAMAVKGYWSSPAGRTPDATLYSALLREVTTKGARARFRKAGRGQFALAAAV